MKIALFSSFVPFIHGGGRNIVDWLEPLLLQQGHQVERVYLPHEDLPDLLVQQAMAYRWVDFEAADRVICFRPPAHFIRHPNKILWFIHHIRVFYDLWDTSYRSLCFPDDVKHRGIRTILHRTDTTALLEAKKIFTNSKVVSKRLADFNNIKSEVLYPPVYEPERFYCHGFNNEIVCISRLESHKRQHLLIEALQYTKSPICLNLCGKSGSVVYKNRLVKMISKLGLQDRVILNERWISEEEKIALLSKCLASAYIPLDEDSYGYPSIEASHSSKAILTTADSGGVLEFVVDGINGYVAESCPKAIAEAMDKFYHNREKTKRMGKNSLARLSELNISWTHVLEKLLT